MDYTKISPGKDLPNDINVVIEIPANTAPVKYEIDKESGAIFIDRFVHTPMHYPCHYGFIPQTLADDGDPLDVCIIADFPVIPGSVMRVRPIGVLIMEDEKGMDEKIIAVPHHKVYSKYDGVDSYKSLPEITIQQIKHFFEHYKDLEKGKWVKVIRWDDVIEAKKIIEATVLKSK